VVLNQSDYDAWLAEQQAGSATIEASADAPANSSASARVAARP